MAGQQPSFPTFDLESAPGYLLHRAYQRAFTVLRRALEPVGLTPPQFGLLALLHREDGQMQATLSERGGIDPNTLVGIVDRLAAAGLVTRARDAKDRRANRVHLTPAGRAVFAQCLPLQRQAVKEYFGVLSFAELDQLRALLKKLLQPKP